VRGAGEAFHAGQTAVLEQVASGRPLPEILAAIVRLIESQDPGMFCSILLFDEAAGCLRLGAAPSLPAELNQAVDGAAIGPDVGSCGTAAHRGERVVVEDIASDPLWARYRQLALPFGLRACWSTPIFSPERALLGTFAMYYREARGPTDREMALVTTASHMAAVAIVRDQAEQSLRRSEARARQLTSLYAVSSRVNEAIVRIRDIQELYEVACRIAVEEGLAQLAWVGAYLEGADRILPVARFGKDDGYIDGITLRLRDTRTSQGPAARALNSGNVAVSNDVASDPDFYWKDEALRRGFRACAVFPLRSEGRPTGVFAIYGDRPGFFHAEEVGVLGALADDISFAVESAAARMRQAAVEEALRESESRLRLLNELGEATRAVSDPELILPVALRLLGRHLRVSRCAYADVAPDGDLCTIPHDYTDGVRSMVGAYHLSDFGPRLADELRRGAGPVVVFDVDEQYTKEEGAEALNAVGIRSFICCTLIQQGVCRAMMAVHHAVPRVWTRGEVALVQAFVERCWATIQQRAAEAKLRRNEDQLRQAQKMEAVGRLAGGVAHDFNNLLSVILATASLAIEDLPVDDPLRPELDEIRKAGERAAALTRQLLAFSRQQVLHPRVVDLNQIVAGLEKMLRRLVGHDAELALVTAPRLGQVLADQGQLEQVIMNLVVNARDALPAGGRITIETANVELDDGEAASMGVAPGSYVRLTVADTGTGMDTATRVRIFEPFFTTKEKGKGTGLGLSTVYGIVIQSGGHVRVHSQPGAGATFEVFLPRVSGETEHEPVEPAAPVTLRGSETILLVEDDEPVRAVVRSILRRGGYNVIEAQNGGEAFLICEQHRSGIDLLLTDVVMPRMSGRELARRVSSLRPEMRVLYVSGYPADAGLPADLIDRDGSLLTKPITPESLLRKVREILDAG
jgi:two-component system, cell cycle sensor histidine kinase and response regulator CckA